MGVVEKPRTAEEMGLMKGFPPSSDKIVTHENQLYGPYNRWSFCNELALNNVVDVRRGNTTSSVPFDYDLMDLSEVTYRNRAGTQFTFEDMVENSYTDGIIVLHKGKIIFERYLNGMRPHTLHAWASGSKSITGILASMLVFEGLLNPDSTVSTYLPELRNSGFGDATIGQVMDMTTDIRFADDHVDPVSESVKSGIAMGWREKPQGYNGPSNAYEFLPTVEKNGRHGVRFVYQTANTDVLSWIMKRLLNKSLADIMSERIWSKIGADRDAFWIVGPAAFETAGSGLLTTLPDMARFGQMMLQRGIFNGCRIIQSEVVEEIQKGGDKTAFASGPAAGPSNRGWSYHDQWWITHNDHDAYLGLGYGGQMLYIDPGVQMVIAKFSSYPTPTPAGNEFYAAFAAFPALAEKLYNKQNQYAENPTVREGTDSR